MSETSSSRWKEQSKTNIKSLRKTKQSMRHKANLFYLIIHKIVFHCFYLKVLGVVMLKSAQLRRTCGDVLFFSPLHLCRIAKIMIRNFQKILWKTFESFVEYVLNDHLFPLTHIGSRYFLQQIVARHSS